MGRVAFFDESVRVRNPGVYVLALVSVSARDAPHARRSLEAMLLPGQRRLHWRDESAERRSEILSLLEALGLHGSAYLALLTRGGRQSRARALCLEAALWDLRNARISEAVIESRGAQDRLDRSTILHAQKAGIADEGLSYRFARPTNEPMLWAADAIAGAFSSLESRESATFEAIATRIAVPKHVEDR